MCLFWLCYVDSNAIKFKLLNGMGMYKLDQAMIFSLLPKASHDFSPILSHPFIIFLLSGYCSAPSPCADDTSLARLFTTASKIYRCHYFPWLLYTLVPGIYQNAVWKISTKHCSTRNWWIWRYNFLKFLLIGSSIDIC